MNDVTLLIDYWIDNSELFWRKRGLDKNRFKSRQDYLLMFEKKFDEGDIPTLATIVVNDIAIGVHTLTELIVCDSAVFHADIWYEEYRGQGIGLYSYIKAIDFFMKKLKLNRIIFKTPLSCTAAIRIKEKIGTRNLGETIYESPLLFQNQKAMHSEVDKTMLLQIKKKYNI